MARCHTCLRNEACLLGLEQQLLEALMKGRAAVHVVSKTGGGCADWPAADLGVVEASFLMPSRKVHGSMPDVQAALVHSCPIQ